MLVWPMKNIVARFPGTSNRVVAITGHYDTKNMPGRNFVGANDGGSSTGFLLELARVVARTPHKDDIWLVWFDGEPLNPNREYLLKHTTQTVRARVASERPLAMNDIGRVRISAAKPLFIDSYTHNRITGSFILIDRESNATAAAGMIA